MYIFVLLNPVNPVVFLDLTLAVFVSSVIMYSSLPGVDVAHKLHWIPGETVSHSASDILKLTL